MPGATVEEILSLLREFGGVTLSNDAGISDLPRIQAEMDQVWNQRKGSFFEGIGFRSVRVPKNEPTET